MIAFAIAVVRGVTSKENLEASFGGDKVCFENCLFSFNFTFYSSIPIQKNNNKFHLLI